MITCQGKRALTLVCFSILFNPCLVEGKPCFFRFFVVVLVLKTLQTTRLVVSLEKLY